MRNCAWQGLRFRVFKKNMWANFGWVSLWTWFGISRWWIWLKWIESCPVSSLPLFSTLLPCFLVDFKHDECDRWPNPPNWRHREDGETNYNEGPQPRSQKCLFLRPQKQAPRRARLWEVGLCSQDLMRWAETSAAWDWRPRVACARTVLAETLL